MDDWMDILVLLLFVVVLVVVIGVLLVIATMSGIPFRGPITAGYELGRHITSPDR